MTKINQNYNLVSGDTRTLQFTILGSDNSAFDLSGVTSVKWGMSRLKDDGSFSATPALQKTLSNGISITNAAEGKLEVSLLPVDTATLSGNYYHELEISIGADMIFTAATGKAVISKDLL